MDVEALASRMRAMQMYDAVHGWGGEAWAPLLPRPRGDEREAAAWAGARATQRPSQRGLGATTVRRRRSYVAGKDEEG